MITERTGNEIEVRIEVRIEAESESAARAYAATNGIDVNQAKWSPNSGDKGGRLYATTMILSRAVDPQ